MLRRIKLNNFRNYKKIDVEFQEGLNVILGENASGKTNLIEAIAFFGILKSFRGVNLAELIREKNNTTRIEAETDEDLFVAAWSDDSQKRKLEINGKKSKTLDFIKNFPVVIFAPDDLLLLTGEPNLRRKFLDSLCVRINPSFALVINEYKKTIRQRNILLINNSSPDELDFWEEKIAKNGSTIWEKRAELGKEMNLYLKKYDLEIQYNYHEKNKNEADFRNSLRGCRNEDRKKGRTSIGPHRDDWELHFKEKNLRTYGSRGEQRTAIISLKAAEAGMISQNNKKPILLLDDILSELDEKHQKHIAELIENYQTILSTTTKPPLDFSQIIKIKNGKINL